MENSTEKDFSLIETLLWEKGEYFLLGLHMERLLASAKHFKRPANGKKIEHALNEASSGFSRAVSYKIRLVLDDTGQPEITHALLETPPPMPVKVGFSDTKTDPSDIFLYHKTTNRVLYDAGTSEARAKGLFDMIFTNLRGEVTEGAITNVMIKTGAGYFTPPVLSGILPGVFRRYLLSSEGSAIKEKVLFKEDLFNADAVFVMNSVRKLLPATLIA